MEDVGGVTVGVSSPHIQASPARDPGRLSHAWQSPSPSGGKLGPRSTELRKAGGFTVSAPIPRPMDQVRVASIHIRMLAFQG